MSATQAQYVDLSTGGTFDAVTINTTSSSGPFCGNATQKNETTRIGTLLASGQWLMNNLMAEEQPK